MDEQLPLIVQSDLTLLLEVQSSLFEETRKAITFQEMLINNAPIRDLACNPLLLTLLCLVFQERNEFDGTRADLYKQGLDVLLYRWDARRDIERDFPEGVTKATLEPLLAQIAYSRFIAGEYFFEQTALESQIASFFHKRKIARGSAPVDGARILNSIRGQHWLVGCQSG